MGEELTHTRRTLLVNYDKRIKRLRQRLKTAQGHEAHKIQEQIAHLQDRKHHLEERYKKVDDVRDMAAELRATAKELRKSGHK